MASEITAQYIADLEHQWKLDRDRLTFWYAPKRTFFLFVAGACGFLNKTARVVASHPVMLRVLVPLFLIWLALEFIPGPYTSYINMIEFAIEYIVWWVGLGILSSIGLGSGLQTGVLFLFPHIMRVCLTAQTCQSVDFDSFSAIWFRTPPTLFKCPATVDPSMKTTFFRVWCRIIIPSFLQAAGTSIGEIPPYLMTRATRLAAIESGDRSDLPEELESKSKFDLFNRFKHAMISFLRTHGFFGVLMMASWPNFAFDICGICCGHFMMPFWTFFGATFIGKAVIRNTYQTLFLVALFSEKYLEKLIVLLQRLTPDYLHLDQYIREAFEEIKENSQQEISSQAPKHTSLLLTCWNGLMMCILCYFILSCMQQFAQYYQSMVDSTRSEELRSKLPPQIRSSLLSSDGSGKLNLPAPSLLQQPSATQLPFHSFGIANPLQKARSSDFTIVSTGHEERCNN